MGMSSDGVLFYGYTFEEQGELFDEEVNGSDEWVDIVLRRRGLPSSARKAVLDEFGCEVGWTGHLEHSYPRIYVVESEVAAYGYRTKDVSGLFEASYPYGEWDAKLDKFMAELSIDAPQDRPRWWLTSRYA